MDSEQLQKLQDQLQQATDSGDPTALTAGAGGLLAGFSLWTLFFGFAYGFFGWFIFKEGRKKRNFGLIGIGIALMVYPYFIYSPWPCFLVGAGLCFGAYKIWR